MSVEEDMKSDSSGSGSKKYDWLCMIKIISDNFVQNFRKLKAYSI